MIALGFLVISTAFVVTLLKSLITLFNTDWDNQPFTGGAVLNILKWPLILLVIFILFIAYGIPMIEA